MTQQVFITKFNYSLATEALKKMLPSVAPEFANIPGCQWKIWLVDEARKEAGGVYLFDDPEALEHFKRSKLFVSVLSNPAFSNFETRTSAIAEKASAITDAPLRQFDFFF
ncbi:MAG: YdhR family protein [Bacteroidota bacterium]